MAKIKKENLIKPDEKYGVNESVAVSYSKLKPPRKALEGYCGPKNVFSLLMGTCIYEPKSGSTTIYNMSKKSNIFSTVLAF